MITATNYYNFLIKTLIYHSAISKEETDTQMIQCNIHSFIKTETPTLSFTGEIDKTDEDITHVLSNSFDH